MLYIKKYTLLYLYYRFLYTIMFVLFVVTFNIKIYIFSLCIFYVHTMHIFAIVLKIKIYEYFANKNQERNK